MSERYSIRDRRCRLLQKFDHEDSTKRSIRSARLFRAFQQRGNSQTVGDKLIGL